MDGENKRGAISGHKAFFRRKPNPEEVTEEKDVLLEKCPNCESALNESDVHKWTERYGVDLSGGGVHFLRQTHSVATVEGATEEAKTFHANMVWFIRMARKKHKKCSKPEERLELHAVMLKALSQFWKGKTYKDKEVEKIREWWLEKRGNELLTFLKYDYVSWENNAAERAIRPFVTRRKICGGSRSERGAERESINMSCITTFIKQKLPLLQAIPLAFRQSLKENSKKVSFSLTC